VNESKSIRRRITSLKSNVCIQFFNVCKEQNIEGLKDPRRVAEYKCDEELFYCELLEGICDQIWSIMEVCSSKVLKQVKHCYK